MVNRILSTILAALLLAGLLTLSAQAVETTYTDVAPDAWYAWCVSDVTDRGLMNGTGGGTFTPDGDLTRAMLVTVLWRLAGEPEAENPAEFSDVPDGQWYSDAIAWASGFQVVEGYGDGVFGTNDPVTREQLAVIFYRWAQEQGYDTRFSPNDSLLREESEIGRYEFVEDDEGGHLKWGILGAPVSEWAEDAVQWAAEYDFLVRREVRGQDPYGGSVYRYCAWENAARAEVAVFLSRFCRAYVEANEATVLLHPDEDLVPLGGYHWDILSMELPETWMGSYSVSYLSNYEWKPADFDMIFWDLTNHEPRSSKGHLFMLTLYDAEETKDRPEAAPGVSGRLCTVDAEGIGKLDLLVRYPDTEPDEEGIVYQSYDPDNPRNYLKMQAQIEQILRSIRFSEGVEVLYTAPAYRPESSLPAAGWQDETTAAGVRLWEGDKLEGLSEELRDSLRLTGRWTPPENGEQTLWYDILVYENDDLTLYVMESEIEENDDGNLAGIRVKSPGSPTVRGLRVGDGEAKLFRLYGADWKTQPLNNVFHLDAETEEGIVTAYGFYGRFWGPERSAPDRGWTYTRLQ